MLGVGWAEMLVIGLVALVVVGPEKLPETARTLGRLYHRLRRAAEEAARTFSAEADLFEAENSPAEKTRKNDPEPRADR